MRYISTIAAVLTVAFLVATTRLADGQSNCVSKLVPCAAYMNSTKPSTECCTAITQVVTNQLSCICALFKNPAALPGINITQALLIPTHCNISNNANACNDLTPVPPGSSAKTPPPAPRKDENAGSMSAWMGLMPTLMLVSALTFLF